MANKQIAEIERQLRELDQRREVLQGLLDGYRALEGLDARRKGAARDTTPKGSLSLRAAVWQVLQEARGEPLKPKEIWERAQKLGAVSAARNPASVSDLMVYQLRDTRPGLKKANGAWRLVPGVREAADTLKEKD